MSDVIGGDEYFEHVQGTTDGPDGKGGRTTVVGNFQTKAGTKVRLMRIICLAGHTGTINILKGDGSTAYFTNGLPNPGNDNGAWWPFGIDLPDGLSISGGTAGSWLIVYRMLR